MACRTCWPMRRARECGSPGTGVPRPRGPRPRARPATRCRGCCSLAEHGFGAPAEPAPLRETREALRALLLDRDAVAGVNAVLARGAQRPRLRAGGVVEPIVDAAPEWRVPWICATAMVDLLQTRGD